MPDVQGALVAPWGRAQALAGAVVLPWGQAARLQAFGTAYTPPEPPPGSTEVTLDDLRATTTLGAASVYRQAHTAEVTDLRTGDRLPVARLTIDLQDGSDLWSLSATSAPDAGGDLFRRLTDRTATPAVQVTIDGRVWRFLVETVSRPRADTGRTVTFGGRSLAAAADAPFQLQTTYSADAPTTAAQLAAGALLQAGVELDWQLVDWVIPEGAVSLTATPLGVVRALAAAVGAVVEAHPSDARVSVRSRYASLPNEWAYLPPDVQVHGSAIVTDSFEVADKPAYTGIFVAGQQSGGLTYVKLEGTSGADQAPMVSDALLTEETARVERARAELGAGGQQARVTATLPVRTGTGEPGVLQRGWVARVVDPEGGDTEIWFGAVRSVNVSLTLPGEGSDGFSLRQTVSLERHTKHIVDPETADPLEATGTIPDLDLTVGEPAAVDLSSYHTGGAEPFTWSLRSGALPSGAAFDGDGLGGTPTFCGVYNAQFRLTDNISQMLDFNELAITVGTNGPEWAEEGPAGVTETLAVTLLGYDNGVFVGAVQNSGGSGTSSTFRRSVDGGETWQTVVTGLTAKQAWAVLGGGGVFLVFTGSASADRSLYRSTDGGLTWALNTTALPSSGFWYANAYGDGRFLAARWATTVMAVSDDGGASWSTRTLPASRNWYGLAKGENRWLLSSRTNRVIYASDDNGDTWAELSTVPGTGTLGRITTGGGKVFVGPLGGTLGSTMWVSSDLGETWETITLPRSVTSYAVTYIAERGYWVQFAPASGGVFPQLVSVDGETWTEAANSLEFSGTGGGLRYGGGRFVIASFFSNLTTHTVAL